MVEIHGFINIRETYEAIDEEFDNEDIIIREIQNELNKIQYPCLEVKPRNGDYFIEISLSTNHYVRCLTDMQSIMEMVGRIAKGSYGLIYIHDDEDCHGHDNEFQVLRLVRGKVDVVEDKLLSPFIPTVEDEWK